MGIHFVADPRQFFLATPSALSQVVKAGWESPSPCFSPLCVVLMKVSDQHIHPSEFWTRTIAYETLIRALGFERPKGSHSLLPATRQRHRSRSFSGQSRKLLKEICEADCSPTQPKRTYLPTIVLDHQDLHILSPLHHTPFLCDNNVPLCWSWYQLIRLRSGWLCHM